MRTHYDNLQVSRNASQRVIRAAWKSLAQEWHPDKHPQNREEAERVLKIINRAYEILSNPETRRHHDEWIASQQESPSGQSSPQEVYDSEERPDHRKRNKKVYSHTTPRQKDRYSVKDYQYFQDYARRPALKLSLLERLSASEILPALVGVIIVVVFFVALAAAK